MDNKDYLPIEDKKSLIFKTYPRIHTVINEDENKFITVLIGSIVRFKYNGKYYRTRVREEIVVDPKEKEYLPLIVSNVYSHFIESVYKVRHLYIPKESEEDVIQISETERLKLLELSRSQNIYKLL